MASKGKGKEKEVVYGKRKVSAGRSGGGAEENRRKRKNRGVLQFFEDAADVDDNEASDDSDFDDCMADLIVFLLYFVFFLVFVGFCFFNLLPFGVLHFTLAYFFEFLGFFL